MENGEVDTGLEEDAKDWVKLLTRSEDIVHHEGNCEKLNIALMTNIFNETKRPTFINELELNLVGIFVELQVGT